MLALVLGGSIPPDACEVDKDDDNDDDACPATEPAASVKCLLTRSLSTTQLPKDRFPARRFALNVSRAVEATAGSQRVKVIL